MKARPSQPLQIILAGAIALSAGGAFGQAVPAPSAPPAVLITTASGGDLKHAERAGDQFGAFAGSRENTEALALALRNGSEVTLLGTDGTSTTFTPATGHMGHGNVTKSMALAQRQLAAIGISNPTPQEVEAALNGGPVTVGSGADARTVVGSAPSGYIQPCIVPCSRSRRVSVRVSTPVMPGTSSAVSQSPSERCARWWLKHLL